METQVDHQTVATPPDPMPKKRKQHRQTQREKTVQKLKSLLALPWDIHIRDLSQFLNLRRDLNGNAFLTNNHSSTSPVVDHVEITPPGTTTIKAPSPLIGVQDQLGEWLAVLGVVVLILWTRRVKTAEQRAAAPTPTKPKATTPTNRDCSPAPSIRSATSSTLDMSTEAESLANQAVDRERILNLVAQNKILQTSMEEQRTILQRVVQQLQSREERLAQMEAEHDQHLKRLSGEMVALAGACQQERVDRVVQETSTDHNPSVAVLGKRIEALAALVQGRDQEHQQQGSLVETKVMGQVQALQEQVQVLDKVHKERLAMDQTRTQKLTREFEVVKKDVEARALQMSKLGQYLKARDEQEAVKMAGLQSSFDDLASKLEDVAEKANFQQVQVSSLQRSIKTKDDEIAGRFQEVEKRAHDREVLQRDACQTLQNKCSSLGQQILCLTKDHQHAKLQSQDVQAKQLECSEELEGLRLKCMTQDEQSLNLSASLEGLSVEVKSCASSHRELKQATHTQAKEAAQGLESLVQELQLHKKEHQEQQETMRKKLKEMNKEHNSSRTRQDTELQRFRVECEHRWAESSVLAQKLDHELTVLKADRYRDDRVSNIEGRHVALARKVEEIMEGFQERLDLEMVSHQAGYESSIAGMRIAFRTLEGKQQRLDKAMDQLRAYSESQSQEAAAEVKKCLGGLQDSLDSTSSQLKGLQSQILKQAEHLSKVSKGQTTVKAEVLVLQGSEMVNREAQEQVSNRMEAVVAKLDGLESQLGATVEANEEQGTQLTEQIQKLNNEMLSLSGKIENHHELSQGYQKDTESEVSDMRSAMQQFNSKLQHQVAARQHDSDKLGLRCRELEDRLDTVCKEVEAIEVQRTKSLQRCVSKDVEIQVGIGLATKTEEDHQSVAQEAMEPTRVTVDAIVTAEGEGHEIVAGVHDGDECSEGSQDLMSPSRSVGEKETIPREKEFLCLSTKWTAFKTELQRRTQAVIDLENHTKERSDGFASRAEALNTEIELQRQQLKKWEDTTHRTEVHWKEMCTELRRITSETTQLKGDLTTCEEEIADLEDSLQEDGISSSSKSRLENQLGVLRELHTELKKKVDGSETRACNCQSECAKLAAKQNLFEGELSRRKARVRSLRASLSDVLDLVAVERESLQKDLTLKREERDTWRVKTEDLYHRLRDLEREKSQIDFDLSDSCIRGAKAHFGPLADNKDELDSVENGSEPPNSDTEAQSRLAAVAQQQDAMQRTLEAELVTSREQRVLLSEKMDKITADRDKAARLEIKFLTLENTLANNQSQIGRVDEEQSKLKFDLNEKVEALRNDIRALEGAQQAHSASLTSRAGEEASFEILTKKIEALATEMANQGQIVAKVGALANSIERCEDQLQRFENEKYDSRADVSSMIDFFKTDLQALKHAFEQNLNSKDKEFSSLLLKVANLVNTSQSHETKLGIIEDRLNEASQIEGRKLEDKAPTTAQILPEYLLQQMNEQYIDLAAKVDLLANELQDERSKKLERKDRDELYLSQMATVRKDLETQQARYQDEMQVKVYDTMLKVFNVLAKRQGIPSAFAVWNSSEESLALSQRSEERKEGREKEKSSQYQGNGALITSRPQSSGQRARGGAGYSMASGIIADNMYLPVIMAAAPPPAPPKTSYS